MRKMLASLLMLAIGLASVSALRINVQPVSAMYNVLEIYINEDGSVTPLNAPITNVGNSTYTLTDDVNITEWHGYSPAGIRIMRSNITFNGNGYTLMGNGGNGVVIQGCNNVTAENMTVEGFGTCMWLEGADNNVIRGNTFYGNRGGSVFYLGSSGNNIIDGNSITNGNYGLEAYWGASGYNNITRNFIGNNSFWAIAFHGGAGSSKFYHNVISGSCINDGPDSTWDDGCPSGGNYWIGYLSPDLYSGPGQNITGGDGIGDNPVQVSYRTNIDHYPFMMINICNVSQTPPMANVLSTDMVNVNATVTHYFPLEQVILNCTYTNGTSKWTSIINMTNIEDDIWNGIIPASPADTNVTYVIIAQDNTGDSIKSTSQGYTFDYPVIPEFPATALLPILFVATLSAVLLSGTRRRVPR